MNAMLARRAMGALFFSFFGTAWLLLWSQRAWQGPLLLDAVIAVLGLALSFHCLRLYRANKAGLDALADTAASRRTRRLFSIINAAQWLLILVGGNVLANVGLAAWVLPAAVAIIGLHFLPLARLFAYPPHYVTGAALVLVALVLPLSTHAPDTPAVPLGAGLVLWASALWSVSYGVARPLASPV